MILSDFPLAALARLLSGALLLWLAAPGHAASVLEDPGYLECAVDANDTMTIGRMAMVFGQDRATLLGTPQLPERLQHLAKRFYDALDKGEVETYAHFAATSFVACAHGKSLQIELDAGKALLCLTRVDIPFFFGLEKRSGASQEDATGRVQSALRAWGYPDGLVSFLAAPSYKVANVEQLNQLQLLVFNSCYLPEDEVRGFYGRGR